MKCERNLTWSVFSFLRYTLYNLSFIHDIIKKAYYKIQHLNRTSVCLFSKQTALSSIIDVQMWSFLLFVT